MTNSDKEISNELTREERTNLASSPCFGLYMMPAYLADAKTSGELCDIDCALDNALVPRLRDQLSEDHLYMMKGTGDLSHAWIPSTMKDIHERIKSRVQLPERPDGVRNYPFLPQSDG